ncbi:MAG: hypothetical protein JXB43_08130 [Dehalococcoidia bacterium]|nr:hypothetical protein [Dehalococcoidia bacterium]
MKNPGDYDFQANIYIKLGKYTLSPRILSFVPLLYNKTYIMGFQEFKNSLVMVVAVIFTISQLILLPVAYFYPREEPTVSFAIWFFPWICALIFSLLFLGSWLWERYHKKKQMPAVVTSEKNVKSSDKSNVLTTMTLEQTRIIFDTLAKMKPEQIATTLNCLTGMVQDAKTNQETKRATKADSKKKGKEKSGKAGNN